MVILENQSYESSHHGQHESARVQSGAESTSQVQGRLSVRQPLFMGRGRSTRNPSSVDRHPGPYSSGGSNADGS
ncbi:hypothetical protein GJ744_006327 [Endocarpon pusillum]|uniref:Uncharacterized protein n=1 Tax=Endocarpon pusillum TaxID=364733 RepID=A0A8H7ANT6_9EURO|nr:hypothetical protein GJ744_006327 [Endocarpon pusillum]